MSSADFYAAMQHEQIRNFMSSEKYRRSAEALRGGDFEAFKAAFAAATNFVQRLLRPIF